MKGSDDDDDEVIILEVKTPATKRKERSNMGSRKKSPAKKKMHVNEKPSASVRKGKWYTMYDRAMAAYKKDRFRDLKSGEMLYNWLSRMKKERKTDVGHVLEGRRKLRLLASNVQTFQENENNPIWWYYLLEGKFVHVRHHPIPVVLL